MRGRSLGGKGVSIQLGANKVGHTLNIGFSPIPSLQTDILDVKLNVAVGHGVNRLFQRFQVLPLQVFE